MGFESLVDQFAGAGQGTGDHAKIVGALMSELQSREGGMAKLLQLFHQNGMGSKVQQWSSGQTQPADPSEVERGLSGSGIIEAIAGRTGTSDSTIKSVLGKAIPVLMHQLVSNGHATAQGQPTGTAANPEDMLKSIVGRIL